jgi:type I restriction enzyme, S subunit
MKAKFPKISVSELVASGEVELKTGPFGTQLRASDYVENGIPVINVRNIGFGTIRPDKLEFISDATRDRLSTHVLRRDDIVFGRKGAVERHVFIKGDQDGWFQGSDCLRLRLNSPRIDPRFASYYFLTEEHQQWMKNQCSHAATMASLNQQILERIELPLPPLPTQRKIAGILSAYDDLIENNLRRIKILEQMAQSLYREWFVHFRFPGHESADFADSALGQIPKGWEVKKLETLYRTSSGGTPSRKNLEYYEEGTIDWVKTGELKDCFILSSEEKITAQALSKSSAKLFPANTVLIALYGATIGQLGILSREAATNQACCAILELEQPFGRAFAYLTLLLRRDDIIGLRLGAAQQNISQAVLRDFEVICPPATLLEAFNQRAEPMFDLLLNLQSRNQTLRRTRDLLLPKLLSGDQNLDGIRP